MITIANANALHIPLANRSVQCVVTSPPYWGLRDYGTSDQIGLESTPAAYVASIVAVMRECWRVLKDDGVLWLNLGDSYSGSGKGGNPDEGKQSTNKGSQTIGVLYGKIGDTARQAALTNVSRRWTADDGIRPKQLIGIPWRVAFALQDDGWYLRQDIIWHKPNPMPESVTDRCTKAHEYVFLLTKQARYYYDAEAIREPSDRPDLIGRATRNYGGGDERAKQTKMNGHPNGRGDLGRTDVEYCNPSGRNRRSVWTVATSPYSGAKGLADYVGDDGKPYKASPDCPIHGHLARERTSYTVGYDARLDQNQRRNSGNGNGHEQAPVSLQSAMTSRNSQDGRGENAQQQSLESIDDYRSEAHRPEYTAPAQTVDRTNRTSAHDEPSDRKTDLKRREYSLSANGHSKRKSKTARAHRTLQRDTASEETHGHIQNTLLIGERLDLDGRIDENNTSEGYASSEIDLSAETSYRNAGIDSPFVTSHMSLYCTCEVVSTDHFATFPPALIEPMILAGSRRGDVVLDPFAGSGTTGAVAVKHGRRAVLLDLNTKYIDLQFERTNGVQMMMPV